MNEHDDQRVYRLEQLIGAISLQTEEIERKVQSLVDVCAAVADDTLRMCFILDELNRVGRMPAMPWDVATALVELHHAISAEKEGLEDGDGVAATLRVTELKAEVIRLREAYRLSLTGEEGPKDEEQPSG